MKDDPVIAEIRRIGHEMSEKFGHDPKRLIKFLQEQEKLHSERDDVSTKMICTHALSRGGQVLVSPLVSL